MALTVTPPPAGISAPSPTLVKPVDLQPALDRLHNAYREGIITAQDIEKRATIGNTDAEAQRRQNEAAGAKAEQERIKQEGGTGYERPAPGLFSRLRGIGAGKASPGPGATPGGAAAPAPTIPAPAAAAAPAVQPGPYTQAALSPDFNPAHESTDDLLNFLKEAGYNLPQQ